MRAIQAILVALVAMIILTAVATAGPNAAKQRVAINMKIYPQGTFVLTPLQTGALKRDSGTVDGPTDTPGRKVVRDGQTVTIYNGAVTTLTGKRGTLTIRDRNEWVDAPTRRPASATHLVSASAPGRSCAAPASTPGSSGKGGMAMQASVASGTRATRAS